MKNPIFREKTWQTFKARYEEFSQEIPEGSLAYAPYLLTYFCDANRIGDLETFFKDKVQNLPGAPRNYQKAVESIRTCHALREKHAPEINAFFGVTP